MKPKLIATKHTCSEEDWLEIMSGNLTLMLEDSDWDKVTQSATYLDNRLEGSEELIYGINTGFGSLCNVRISDDELEKLQINLIRSHACGLGNEVPKEIIRLILFLKIRNFAHGNSAVSPELIRRLLSLFNNDLLPVIYEQGSLGASGDLAPLAHLALLLIGEGELYKHGKKYLATEIDSLWEEGIYHLKPKEGLALINGTQFSLAYLLAAYLKVKKLQRVALVTAALSIEGFDCRNEPFAAPIHTIRAGNGQPEIAAAISALLADSEAFHKVKLHVQDPYSFRCIPQVHGASLTALRHIESVIFAELNSVTDNPNVFPEENLILSGGNFHAQPLALAADYLALAAAELASISERRTFLLISGQRELPPFLINNPGLESGLMIAQYTAAAVVSQNKQLATPASVDSIVSSNGQEDHVSMAANAGVKALKVADNLEKVLAIEFFAACQAIELRKAETSDVLKKLLEEYRQNVSFLHNDRVLHFDFIKTMEFFKNQNYFKATIDIQ